MPGTSIMQLLHAFFSARGNIVRIDSCTDDSICISLTVAIRLIGAPVNRYTPMYHDISWYIVYHFTPTVHSVSTTRVTFCLTISCNKWSYPGWQIRSLGGFLDFLLAPISHPSQCPNMLGTAPFRSLVFRWVQACLSYACGSKWVEHTYVLFFCTCKKY